MGDGTTTQLQHWIDRMSRPWTANCEATLSKTKRRGP
jgi:hypothetical protein